MTLLLLFHTKLIRIIMATKLYKHSAAHTLLQPYSCDPTYPTRPIHTYRHLTLLILHPPAKQ